MYVCMYSYMKTFTHEYYLVWVCPFTIPLVWKLEDNLMEADSLYHVGSGDKTQILKFDSRYP